MVSEEKLRELRGDELRKMNQNGMLPLIIAHLFSMPLIREIFGRQVEQGKGHKAHAETTPAPAAACSPKAAVAGKTRSVARRPASFKTVNRSDERRNGQHGAVQVKVREGPD